MTRDVERTTRFERDGTVSPLITDLQTYSTPRFSPDGKKLAMGILRPDSTMTDLWLYNMTRKSLSRMTFADADDEKPIWSPDGERIIFFSLRGNGNYPNMYSRRADGSGEVEHLQPSDHAQIPQALTPNGQTVIYIDWQ